MVLVQNWPFSNFFFYGNIRQENVPYDILDRKNAFLCYKKRSSKTLKIDIFPRGNPWFWSKNGHFQTFFLFNIGPENVFYDILERKNAFQGYKKKKFKKSKNWYFSKGLKNGHFSTFVLRQYKPGKCLLR